MIVCGQGALKSAHQEPLWSALPPELTHMAFSFLPSQDLVTAALACRNWKRVAYEELVEGALLRTLLHGGKLDWVKGLTVPLNEGPSIRRSIEAERGNSLVAAVSGNKLRILDCDSWTVTHRVAVTDWPQIKDMAWLRSRAGLQLALLGDAGKLLSYDLGKKSMTSEGRLGQTKQLAVARRFGRDLLLGFSPSQITAWDHETKRPLWEKKLKMSPQGILRMGEDTFLVSDSRGFRLSSATGELFESGPVCFRRRGLQNAVCLVMREYLGGLGLQGPERADEEQQLKEAMKSVAGFQRIAPRALSVKGRHFVLLSLRGEAASVYSCASQTLSHLHWERGEACKEGEGRPQLSKELVWSRGLPYLLTGDKRWHIVALTPYRERAQVKTGSRL